MKHGKLMTRAHLYSYVIGIVAAVIIVDLILSDFLIKKMLRTHEYGYLLFMIVYYGVMLVVFVLLSPKSLLGALIRGVLGGCVAGVIGYVASEVVLTDSFCDWVDLGVIGAVSRLMNNFLVYFYMINGFVFSLGFWFAFSWLDDQVKGVS